MALTEQDEQNYLWAIEACSNDKQALHAMKKHAPVPTLLVERDLPAPPKFSLEPNAIAYYLRDRDHVRRMTVVVKWCDPHASRINPERIYARGIALCSLHDAPSRVFGLRLALYRAALALNSRKNTLPIVTCAGKKVLQTLTSPFESSVKLYKSEVFPVLTEYEIKLIRNRMTPSKG